MTPLTEASTPLALWAAGAAILVLIAVSALLTGCEAALTLASRTRLHGMADRGDTAAMHALRVGEDRERLIGAVLLGGRTATIVAAMLAGWIGLELFGGAGLVLAALLITLVVMIVAEILPRAWAVADPEAAAARAAGFAGVATMVLAPVMTVVRAIAGPLARGFGLQPALAGHPAHHETASAASQPAEDAEREDRERLLGALDLGGRQVEEVMMHRRDIEMIDAGASPAEILAQAINSPHTRLPIFRGEPENIVGVIHAKDFSRAVHSFVEAHGGAAALEGFDIMDVAMPPYFVPESTPLDEQMHAFLRRRSHFALVVDEYGALQGLVTLEDIIEEIVGDIADEHDVEEPAGIEPQPDGSVEVDGAVSIRDLNRARDWDLPDEEANTIAGLVIHAAQAIPTEGQTFSFHGFRFEVLAREGNRLARLRVRPLD